MTPTLKTKQLLLLYLCCILVILFTFTQMNEVELSVYMWW